jgi:hypothetical protein
MPADHYTITPNGNPPALARPPPLPDPPNPPTIRPEEMTMTPDPHKDIDPDILHHAQTPPEIGVFMHLITHDRLGNIPDTPGKTHTIDTIHNRYVEWFNDREPIVQNLPRKDLQDQDRAAIIQLGDLAKTMKNDVDHRVTALQTPPPGAAATRGLPEPPAPERPHPGRRPQPLGLEARRRPSTPAVFNNLAPDFLQLYFPAALSPPTAPSRCGRAARHTARHWTT